MNILYINNTMSLGGGVQKCIFQLSKYFSDKNNVYVASQGGEYCDLLVKYGIEHFYIKNTDNKDIISVFFNIMSVYRIIKKYNIDIVHSHHRMTTLYLKILTLFLNVKIVHTAHLYTEDKIMLTKLALNNVPIISVSNGVGENLRSRYKIKSLECSTIYNTIDFEQVDSVICNRIQELKNDDYFLVGVVSRMEPIKGINFLINAIQNIFQNNNYKIKFIFIGDGTYKSFYEKLIKDKGLIDEIIMLGNINNVKDYLNIFDVLVQSSLQEGLPLSLIEALSQELPIIATDIPGNNEVVINGLNGLLVEAENPQQLSDAIVKVYLDRDLLANLKKNTKKVFKELFTQEKYYNSHEKFYLELINKE